MATIRILLGIICLTAFGGPGLPGSGIVTEHGLEKGLQFRLLRLGSGKNLQVTANSKAALVLSIALKELGQREKTNHNDGTHVESYLRYAGAQKGDPWCAAFVSWVFGQAGYVLPRSAWSPALLPKTRQTINPLPADVFGIYFPELKRIAHCGLVRKKQGNWIYTIEGNTNMAGGREGDGVYSKIRHRRTIAVYANWLGGVKKGGKP